ncbi:MAG: APC family permease [Candidatus Dojkabacteria bacterium]|nr:APC family permease [Candidatus Dojkabacteria bacterium]MDQ7021190.1 APC family permease [Candidatus Dojkabacteria bacterium]
MNGGAYNALLNGTSKTLAATAGVMTILSYVATAVISATIAVEYLFSFLEHALGESVSFSFSDFVIPAAILILFLFAILVISGVKDSAKVASSIFVAHILTLAGFIIFSIVYLIMNHDASFFSHNSDVTSNLIIENGGIAKTLFLAFSASLLGVSGFKSSSNFVEEQEKGVFKKTLRNMLIGVLIFNPLIAFLVLNILPFDQIVAAKDFLLADAAFEIGGGSLLGLIAIDAFLVLCGAVLTSYVGLTGLVNRMALDECLPNFLLKENKKGSHPRIIISFFLLSTSILLITGGKLLSLAGVYTISFLGVMTLFALGNLILRQTRTELKRPFSAPILYVILAFTATFVGLIGNIIIDVNNIYYFLIYFLPSIFFVYAIVYKKDILRSLIKVFSGYEPVRKELELMYNHSTQSEFFVFIHHVNRIYPILNYINRNENGWNITIVTCKGKSGEDSDKIKEYIPKIQNAGVFPHFNINFEYIDKNFPLKQLIGLRKKRT